MTRSENCMTYTYENATGDKIQENFPWDEAPPSIIIDEDDEKVEYFLINWPKRTPESEH